MLKREIKEKLDKKGVKYPSNATKMRLEVLLSKHEDKPSGKVEKVKENGDHVYTMLENVKHNHQFYEKGSKVKLTGEIRKLFLKNNYAK